jgi:hypothetical protein
VEDSYLNKLITSYYMGMITAEEFILLVEKKLYAIIKE